MSLWPRLSRWFHQWWSSSLVGVVATGLAVNFIYDQLKSPWELPEILAAAPKPVATQVADAPQAPKTPEPAARSETAKPTTSAAATVDAPTTSASAPVPPPASTPAAAPPSAAAADRSMPVSPSTAATAVDSPPVGAPSLGRAAAPITEPAKEPEMVARPSPAAEPSPPVGGPYVVASAPAQVEPGPVAGKVERVLTTGALIINGKTIALAGVVGLGPPYSEQMAKFIEEQGGQVRCTPQGEQHVCFVAAIDIALAALTNGAARLGGDPNPAYRTAEADARSKKRGIFKTVRN